MKNTNLQDFLMSPWCSALLTVCPWKGWLRTHLWGVGLFIFFFLHAHYFLHPPCSFGTVSHKTDCFISARYKFSAREQEQGFSAVTKKKKSKKKKKSWEKTPPVNKTKNTPKNTQTRGEKSPYITLHIWFGVLRKEV